MWADVDPDQCRHMASLGNSDLTYDTSPSVNHNTTIIVFHKRPIFLVIYLEMIHIWMGAYWGQKIFGW